MRLTQPQTLHGLTDKSALVTWEQIHTFWHNLAPGVRQRVLEKIASRPGRSTSIYEKMLRELARQRKGPNEQAAIARLGFADEPLKWRPRRIELFNKLFDMAVEADQNPAVAPLLGLAQVMVGMSVNLGPLIQKRIEKGILAARKVQDFPTEWNLLQYQKLILLKQDSGRTTAPSQLAKVMERSIAVMKMDAEVKKLKELRDLIRMKKGAIDPHSEPIVSLIGQPGQPVSHLSERADVFAHQVRYNLGLYHDDPNSCEKACKAILSLLRKHRELQNDPYLANIATSSALNLSLVLIQLRRFKEACAAFQDYEKFGVKQSDPGTYFMAQFKFQIRLCTESFDLAGGEKEIERFEKLAKQSSFRLSEQSQIEISWRIARFYMFNGNHSKAAYWSRLNFRNKLGTAKPIMVGYSRVIYLLAKFGLGEWEEVRTEARRTSQYFKRTRFQNMFTDCLLSMIQEAAHDNAKARNKALALMKKNLAALGAQPEHSVVHSLFDIPSLVDSWLEGKPFQQIYLRQG